VATNPLLILDDARPLVDRSSNQAVAQRRLTSTSKPTTDGYEIRSASKACLPRYEKNGRRSGRLGPSPA